MAKIDIFTENWSDIVFEGRNQEYGAYQLRKLGPKYLVRGIVFSIIGFGLAISAPVIMKYISDALPKEEVKVTEDVTLADIPPIDKNEPPPPPVEPPPPLKTTVKFTPPVIKKDEEVPQDEPPPAQEDLKDKEASTVSQEGDPNGVPEGLGDGNEVVEEAAPQVFTIVEEMPSFPGGDTEMMKYIQSKTTYPQIAKENGIQGRVFVEFVVDFNGQVTQSKIARGIGGGCDEEALRVIKSMPKWKPGRQNGRPALVRFTIPVNFKLR